MTRIAQNIRSKNNNGSVGILSAEPTDFVPVRSTSAENGTRTIIRYLVQHRFLQKDNRTKKKRME